MKIRKAEPEIHPADRDLADLLENSLTAGKKESVETHIAGCDECMVKIVSCYESVGAFRPNKGPKRQKGRFMKKINLYLVLAVVSFALSFVTPRYFLQLLVATLLLGTKWIADSKTTRMLVMIYEAWKKGGEKEASRILETIDSGSKDRF